MEKITNMRQSFADATEEVRTTLVHQFERLINKIVSKENIVVVAPLPDDNLWQSFANAT